MQDNLEEANAQINDLMSHNKSLNQKLDVYLKSPDKNEGVNEVNEKMNELESHIRDLKLLDNSS